MTREEFRRYLESYRRAANDEATAFKDPYITLDYLMTLKGMTSIDGVWSIAI